MVSEKTIQEVHKLLIERNARLCTSIIAKGIGKSQKATQQCLTELKNRGVVNLYGRGRHVAWYSTTCAVMPKTAKVWERIPNSVFDLANKVAA